MNEKLFPERLKQLRLEKKMTLDELADAIGTTKTTLSRYENAERSPKLPVVGALANYFNVDMAWLSGISESEKSVDIIPIYSKLNIQRQKEVYKFAEQQLSEQNHLVEFPRSIVTGRSSAAGAPINGDNEDCNSSTMIVNTLEIPKSADEIVTIAGDSMEPTYEQGSQVFVHWQPGVEQGEVAIVAIQDEGVTCKKVYYDWENGEIILRSINEKYEDRIFPMDDVRVIGKVL